MAIADDQATRKVLARTVEIRTRILEKIEGDYGLTEVSSTQLQVPLPASAQQIADAARDAMQQAIDHVVMFRGELSLTAVPTGELTTPAAAEAESVELPF